MAWQDLVLMKRKKRRELAERAALGNKPALKRFLQLSSQVKVETNKRLRNLEKSNLDYGSTYNNLMYYLQSELNSNRLQSNTAMKNDVWDIYLQNEQAIKFLKKRNSLVVPARNRENARIKALKNKNILPPDFKRKDAQDFLKFLGNEEVTASIDEYGRSDVIVDMIWDSYSNAENKDNWFKIMDRALAEYIDGRITIDDAMLRGGIKLEDYMSKKYERNTDL